MAVVPIFISSTFRDFHAERDVLTGPVRERLDELVAEYGCRIEMIDLRWGVDTTDDAEDAAQRKVLDICLAQIDRARPLFLGLLGERYGMVPDPTHARYVASQAGILADRQVEGLSITELEFGHGGLWPSTVAHDSVVFVRTVEGPTPPGWRDADPSQISALRGMVQERASRAAPWRVVPYSCAIGPNGQPNLGSVTIAGEGRAFEDAVLSSLQSAVVGRARGLAEARGTDRDKAAEHLFRDNRAIMVGRDDLQHEALTHLSGDTPGRVVLLGESGMGKSTLLAALDKDLRQRGRQVATTFVGVGESDGTIWGLVGSLAGQMEGLLGRDLGIPQDTVGDDDLLSWWIDAAESTSSGLGELVVVVDALDQLRGGRHLDLLSPLTTLPATVSFLCSTTDPTHAEILRAAGARVIHVGALDGPTAAQAAAAWSLAQGRTLPAATLGIVAAQARDPMWIRLGIDLLNGLGMADFEKVAHRVDQGAALGELLTETARSFPDLTTDLVGRLLDRVGDRVGRDLGDLAVGLLATARSGLRESELAGLLPATVENRQVVAAQVKRVLGAQVRERDQSGRLTFTHNLVRDAALSRRPAEAHLHLASRLIEMDQYDEVELLDLLWHVLHTGPGELSRGLEHLAFALNNPVLGTGQTVMDAIVSTQGAALDLLGCLERGSLTDEALSTLLDHNPKEHLGWVSLEDRDRLARVTLDLVERGTHQELNALNNAGHYALELGETTRALTLHKRQLSLAKRLFYKTQELEFAHSQNLAARNIAHTMLEDGDIEEAWNFYDESIEVAEALFSKIDEYAELLVISLATSPVFLVRLDRADDALKNTSRAVTLVRTIPIDYKRSPGGAQTLCRALASHASTLSKNGTESKQAVALMEEACRVADSLVGFRPTSSIYLHLAAHAHYNLYILSLKQDNALPHLIAAVSNCHEALVRYPKNRSAGRLMEDMIRDGSPLLLSLPSAHPTWRLIGDAALAFAERGSDSKRAKQGAAHLLTAAANAVAFGSAGRGRSVAGYREVASRLATETGLTDLGKINQPASSPWEGKLKTAIRVPIPAPQDARNQPIWSLMEGAYLNYKIANIHLSVHDLRQACASANHIIHQNPEAFETKALLAESLRWLGILQPQERVRNLKDSRRLALEVLSHADRAEPHEMLILALANLCLVDLTPTRSPEAQSHLLEAQQLLAVLRRTHQPRVPIERLHAELRIDFLRRTEGRESCMPIWLEEGMEAFATPLRGWAARTGR